MTRRRTAVVAGMAYGLTAMLAVPAWAQGLGDLLTEGQKLLGSGSAGSGGGGSGRGLETGTIAQGLIEALRLGTEAVVGQLGQPGGFADDAAVRIPLPGGLEQVRSGLVAAGLGPAIADLETRMNRAAELAVPEASQLFQEAIAAMTIDDARGILSGPDDSATRYFEGQMRPTLAERMTPIVETELGEVGAVQAFDSFLAQYEELPFMPNVRGNLTSHVVDEALGGLFHYVALEEQAIRSDPAARTTELLQTVFGGG